MARKFVDLRQLGKAIQKLPDDAKKSIKKAVTDSALMVERDAKINAPVDTGTLRNSITHNVDDSGDEIIAEIGSGVKYAPYLEYGTSKQPAQPYLGPALAKNNSAIQKKIKDAIKDALKG